MFALWSSPNHISIKSRSLVKKTNHLIKPIYLILIKTIQAASVWGDFWAESVAKILVFSKPNQLNVVIIWFSFTNLRVYSIDSSKMMGNFSWSLELQPVHL